jgi:lipoate---protein ligase
MKQAIRILDTGLRPARWNVAMTAALAELHVRGHVPDTVRFHRYPACVLLGRNQDVGRAANAEYCRRARIEIARRVTGGGAVFMTPRTLAWDVVVDRRAWGADLGSVTRSICEGVAAGLSRLGVPARFRSPNDIEIGGRKVSGSSGYAEGRSAVLQGTVLAADDIATMARALRIPEPTLRDGVTCLAHALADAPPMPSIIACVSRGLVETLQREPAIEHPSVDDLALCEALLRGEIGTDGFVSGAPAAQVAGTAT